VLPTVRRRVAGLQSVNGFPFEVHASRGAEEHAKRLAAMVEDARGWFAGLLGTAKAETYLLCLSPQDWDAHCPVPVFGVPYEDEGRGITVGHGRAGFVTEFVEAAWPHADAALRARLQQAYGSPADATPYLDLVAVHELAHSVQIQDGWGFPRFWLYEFWAQVGMVAYVAERHPKSLASLDPLHDAAARIPTKELPAWELDGMGTSFEHGAWLYAWYEFRLGALARLLWERAGRAGVKRLFTEFRDERMGDADILQAFRAIHPDLEAAVRRWPTAA